MSHLNIDAVEEDATELQFPKDWMTSIEHCKQLDISVERKKIFTSDVFCITCENLVSEPYVRCTTCAVTTLCISCFAKGRETVHHKNYHTYTIIENSFSMIGSSNWSAREEESLTKLIQECGFGNWMDISLRLTGRSSDDCKKHYLQCYIDNQSLPNLPVLKDTVTYRYGMEPVFYLFKVEETENPPRYATECLNYKLMSGYHAARSDFEYDFDNHAEHLIPHVQYKNFSYYSHDKLAQNLQISLVEAYNTKLRERERRKKIIKEHGLISLQKTTSTLHRSVTKLLIERFSIFTQILNGIQFDYIVDCINQIGEVRAYLQKLFYYRRNGIKCFSCILLFEELSELQNEFYAEKKKISLSQFKLKNAVPEAGYNCYKDNFSRRKKASPIKVYGLLGYNKLSSNEKNLCSVIRVVPEAYINYKLLLMNENKKCGFVKLAEARQLLKIDVNKTKKIHELLVKEGYIKGF
ncbi:transcriptional adapter 2-alpha [Copidosoma floridanum]|uniref:transcriptional adapter 2-alpha n=1 Tax=Copidosoma floridanum TaxID=29053 RepID=UPI0006C9CE9F|nr:transcriptional adapter 2-alpha [Copidosoma floridanum]